MSTLILVTGGYLWERALLNKSASHKKGDWAVEPQSPSSKRENAYCTSTARLSLIFFCQMAGPVMWTDSPLLSTATVTGMSFTSNS